jgi:sugar/nucleoside kinase (ribokinase family)
VNAREAESLTGAPDVERAARALARGRRAAVVTSGADGAVGVEDERLVRATAPAVEVADATGAGDVFVAAFVWARRRGLELEPALAWSCLAASLCVRAPTAVDGAPRLDELLRQGRSLGLNPP